MPLFLRGLVQFAELSPKRGPLENADFSQKKSWANVHLTPPTKLSTSFSLVRSRESRHNHAKWDTYVEHHFSVMNALFSLFNAFSCMIIVRTFCCCRKMDEQTKWSSSGALQPAAAGVDFCFASKIDHNDKAHPS